MTNFCRNVFTSITRKSSFVNARGIPPATYQVFLMLSYPRGGGGGTHPWMGGTYLGVPSPSPILTWQGRGSTYLGQGVPTSGTPPLPCPDLAGGRGTYLGLPLPPPDLARERGYLLLMWGGDTTLGYPPSLPGRGTTPVDRQIDRHVLKHYLPVVLRTWAVNIVHLSIERLVVHFWIWQNGFPSSELISHFHLYFDRNCMKSKIKAVYEIAQSNL